MANFAKDKENPGLAASLLHLVARLRRCCDQMEQQIRQQAELSEAQCTLLQAAPVDEPISTGDLCRRVDLSPSRGGRVIDELVQQGFFVRTPNPTDRRITMLALTAEGCRLKQQIMALMTTCEVTILQKLSTEELTTVQTGLATLLQAMETH
jgi:DNA-binding MarR family transcriptional regulator